MPDRYRTTISTLKLADSVTRSGGEIATALTKGFKSIEPKEPPKTTPVILWVWIILYPILNKGGSTIQQQGCWGNIFHNAGLGHVQDIAKCRDLRAHLLKGNSTMDANKYIIESLPAEAFSEISSAAKLMAKFSPDSKAEGDAPST